MTEEVRMARHGPNFDDQEIRREVKRYKALGDETRLKMVRVLVQGERCVCELLDMFRVGQSTVSHHLKILENAGLISSRRVGKFVYYAIVRQDDEGKPDSRF
ncbi:MAG: ArsR/SmtB family transcription factor [Desulfitobacteriaceae bacterium]